MELPSTFNKHALCSQKIEILTKLDVNSVFYQNFSGF